MNRVRNGAISSVDRLLRCTNHVDSIPNLNGWFSTNWCLPLVTTSAPCPKWNQSGMFALFLASHGVTDCSRLLEIAPNYFDISSFPEGETKRALQRVAKARSNGIPIPDAASLLRNLLKRFTFFWMFLGTLCSSGTSICCDLNIDRHIELYRWRWYAYYTILFIVELAKTYHFMNIK